MDSILVGPITQQEMMKTKWYLWFVVSTVCFMSSPAGQPTPVQQDIYKSSMQFAKTFITHQVILKVFQWKLYGRNLKHFSELRQKLIMHQ